MKKLIYNNDWTIGQPGNGVNWQCPDDCNFWKDYQSNCLPEGDLIHLRFGTGAMNHPLGVNGFHNSKDAPKYFDKIQVIEGEDHKGGLKNLLKLTGETPEAPNQTVMLNRRFDEPLKWEYGKVLVLATWFKPVSDLNLARFNIELRGRTLMAREPQVLSLFLGKNGFVQYRNNPYAPNTQIDRQNFYGVKLVSNTWHKLVMQVYGGVNANSWVGRVNLNVNDTSLISWVSPSLINGVSEIHTYAVGDERHNDDWGGTFLFEPIRVFSRGINE